MQNRDIVIVMFFVNVPDTGFELGSVNYVHNKTLNYYIIIYASTLRIPDCVSEALKGCLKALTSTA